MTLKNIVSIALLSTASLTVYAQAQPTKRPKLVVGIVVDQMRYDYVYKYWNKYGNKGFKRLVTEGTFCQNTHYNYSPTVTAAGHASIFTGASPSQHGIVGNDWYNRKEKKGMYCTEDETVQCLGGTEKAGKMSPKNMLTTTIGDEMHLAQQFKNKVIGVSLKDRSSILPAGHSANAAYWFDGKSGNFISSTHYMEKLPDWVNSFNSRKLPQSYIQQPWTTLLPINTYTESTVDETPYEETLKGEDKPTFPHDLQKIYAAVGSFEMLRTTPHGNSIVREMAMSAIENERLGITENNSDMITISFSSTDYVGHQYGTDAIETEDTYLRLDKELEILLNYLYTKIGKKNVLLFLTADHGAVPVPNLLSDKKIPAGYTDGDFIMDSGNKYLKQKFGIAELIEEEENNNLYLDLALIAANNLDIDKVELELARFLQQQDGIKTALTSTQISTLSNANYAQEMVANGYYNKRSGNVVFGLNSGWLTYKKKGTSHGTLYTYDTHVPLIWWGANVSKGKADYTHHTITQIAPTVTTYLGIEKPSGSTANPIIELLVK
jgi:predicted AlkP superfamily pyrophosphatase or phosphodiesterase